VDVLVIERDEAGMAASTANAGSLHVQLLSYDFGEDGPEDGGPAGHMLPLAPQSIALWKEIAAEAGEDLGIQTEGGLMVADSEPAMRWLRKKSEMEQRLGIESHVLGANELRNLAPAISERMIGADFVPAEGYGDPLRGTMAVLKLALEARVRVIPGTEARGLAREGSRWVVRTGRGEVRAAKVVNATGPWAGVIGGMVGLRLPVRGTAQQVIATEPVPQRMTRHLIAYAKRHLSLKQQASGGFLIGGGWFGEVDAATGRTRNLRRSIEGNLWVCGQVLPVLRGLHFIRSWTGLSPVTDRTPILGEAPGAPGFFNVLSGNGYTLAPILGRLTAEAVQGRGVDPRYTLARFR
jgi:D-hydroxyproline dehydrogenase subunit alpha